MPADTEPVRTIAQEWAESLGDHLNLHGLTRKGLRNALSEYGVVVTEQAIGCWLRGETAPRPEHQAALAAILCVPVHRLFPIPPARKAS